MIDALSHDYLGQMSTVLSSLAIMLFIAVDYIERLFTLNGVAVAVAVFIIVASELSTSIRTSLVGLREKDQGKRFSSYIVESLMGLLFFKICSRLGKSRLSSSSVNEGYYDAAQRSVDGVTNIVLLNLKDHNNQSIFRD